MADPQTSLSPCMLRQVFSTHSQWVMDGQPHTLTTPRLQSGGGVGLSTFTQRG